MEDKIIVKHSVKNLIGTALICVCILLFFGVLLLAAIWANGDVNGFFWLFLIVFAVSILVMAIVIRDYFVGRLELSSSGCTYQASCGRKQKFMLRDVAAVKTKEVPSIKGEGIFLTSLVGRDGEILAEIDSTMIGSEKVIPFFETYNASAVRTETGWLYPEKVLFNPYGEKMVVKYEDAKGLQWFMIVFLIIGMLLFGAAAYSAWTDAKWGLFVFLLLFELFLMYFVVSMRKGFAAQKNFSLVLTTGICSYTDLDGTTREFRFEEIAKVNKIRKAAIRNKEFRTYSEIVLAGGEIAATIEWSSSISNSTEIQQFVEYHKRKNEIS